MRPLHDEIDGNTVSAFLQPFINLKLTWQVLCPNDIIYTIDNNEQKNEVVKVAPGDGAPTGEFASHVELKCCGTSSSQDPKWWATKTSVNKLKSRANKPTHEVNRHITKPCTNCDKFKTF